MAGLNQLLYGADQAPAPKKGDPIGLCANPQGVPFQCGTCQYFQNGVCGNPRPKLNGKQVQPDWCCDWYARAGMKTIIK